MVRDYSTDNCKLETPFTSYVSLDKINRLYDILINLHLLMPNDKKFSHSTFMKVLHPDSAEDESGKKDSVKNLIDEE